MGTRWVLELETIVASPGLSKSLNFARFYLPRLLPSLRRVLYLDADVIVAGDVAALYDAALPKDELCAATLRKTLLGDKGIASLRGEKLQRRFRQRYGAGIPLEQHGFNAGVFVFNVRAWHALSLVSQDLSDKRDGCAKDCAAGTCPTL